MCGIAGILNLNATLEYDVIKRFTDSMKHRGPDGGDYILLNQNKLAFGHRRLSILDLTDAGKQPMQWSNRYTITYNGEIYNFIELRKELEIEGIKFYTQTDTEVILAAYHQWGFNCFNKFNGMWALALYDAKTNNLLLCRDRFGVKPLYYLYQQGKQLAFASETLAFKYLENFRLTHDVNHISASLNNPVNIEGTGYTIWEGVKQLLPGHYIQLNLNAVKVEQKRWFEIPKIQLSITYAEAQEEFFSLLSNAVKLRLRSDVPVATALSGGLDSSSVYAMLYHLKKLNLSSERVDFNKIKGFVATFDGTIQDETEYAKAVVEHCKGEAEFLKTDFTSIISTIESSTRLFNDITATPISVLGDVYKSMRQHNYLVSLDGHGVDEMLYGYRSLVGMAITESIVAMDKDQEKDLTNTFVSMFHANLQIEESNRIAIKSQNFKTLLAINSPFGKVKYKLKQKIKSAIGSKPHYYSPVKFLSNQGVSLNELKNSKDLSNKPIDLSYYNTAERELVIDFYYRNIPYNMRDFDRAAMQHGVEIRMPFMDYNLVNFVFSLPMHYKVGHGFTKRVMRDAMKNLLPEKVRLRKLKIGMGAPIHDWFNQQLSQYLLDTVHSQKFLQNNLWEGAKLRDMVEKRCFAKSWELHEAQQFWNILNAHIILT